MGRNIWVSSDFHLRHSNILKFVDHEGNKVRDFADVDKMDQHLLERHNSVVKPGDIFYTLGDVFLETKNHSRNCGPSFTAKSA
jgi:calcineurin-like phosphoesterase family protein